MKSKWATEEFSDKQVNQLILYCTSLARRLQNPVMEIAGCFNMDNDIKLINVHPLQHLVPEEALLRGFERAFMAIVNESGVDVWMIILFY